jgi:predicted nucleic acid-binding protein
MLVVLDTNILCKAVLLGNLDHISVLMLMMQYKHCLTLDYEHMLENEYRGEVGKYELFTKWWKEMHGRALVYFCDGHLSERIAQDLMRLGFHEPQDHLVIALAIHSGKYIITEDSDFGKGDPIRAGEHVAILNYLSNSLELIVDNAAEACERLKSAS